LIAIVRVFGISPFSSKWLGGKPSLFPSASPLGEDCRANGRATAGNVTAGRAAAFAREQSRVRPRGATRRREPDTRADWLGQQAMGGPRGPVKLPMPRRGCRSTSRRSIHLSWDQEAARQGRRQTQCAPARHRSSAHVPALSHILRIDRTRLGHVLPVAAARAVLGIARINIVAGRTA
jgi:hypothetical protein